MTGRRASLKCNVRVAHPVRAVSLNFTERTKRYVVNHCSTSLRFLAAGIDDFRVDDGDLETVESVSLYGLILSDFVLLEESIRQTS